MATFTGQHFLELKEIGKKMGKHLFSLMTSKQFFL